MSEVAVEIKPVDKSIPQEAIESSENQNVDSLFGDKEKANFLKIERVSSRLEDPRLSTLTTKAALNEEDFAELLQIYGSNKDVLEKLMADDVRRWGYGPTQNQYSSGRSHVLEILNNYFSYIKNQRELSYLQEGSLVKKESDIFIVFGSNLLHKNLGKIEEVVYAKESYGITTRLAMDSVVNLARVSINEEVKKDAVDFLIKNFEKTDTLTQRGFLGLFCSCRNIGMRGSFSG